MIVLKSSLGMKVAMGVLGLTVGIGGIAAGAGWHAKVVHPTQQRLYVATIVAIQGDLLTLHTRAGHTVILFIAPQAGIRYHKMNVSHATLHMGETVIVHVVRTKKGLVYINYVLIVKMPKGP
jgi:hypothetical protein